MDSEKIYDSLKQSVAKENGTERLQLLALSAWVIQLGIFGLATAFRYSGEPGGWFGQYSRVLSSEPGWWAFLDWPVLPLIVAVVLIIVLVPWRRARPEATLPDLGQVGALLCMVAFTLSNGSSYFLTNTLIGIWLCAILSLRKGNVLTLATAGTALLLLVSCLLRAYMYDGNCCNIIEISLIAGSGICGAASTGVRKSSSKSMPLAMPGWFSLLLAMLWWLPNQPSIRMLVMFELSSAFIAGRYLFLSRGRFCVSDNEKELPWQRNAESTEEGKGL